MARTLPEPDPICFDCGTDNFIDPVTGYHLQYSVPGRIFCAPCYRWRIRHGLEFDERHTSQLEHAEVFTRR